MNRIRALLPIFLLLNLMGIASVCFGQNSGSISGTIYDPSQAVIPGASVVATNVATGIEGRSTSSADGNFTLLQLQPGTYRLTVEADGFKAYLREDLVVQVSGRINLPIQLELGQTSEVITVTESIPLLRTEDAQSGEVIDNNFISSLPQINRNPFDLLRLSGNVQGAETTGIQPGEQSEVRINGGRTSSVEYFVDGGASTTGRAHNLSNQTPSINAVQEFKVVTSGASAEYGRISGGYVELVTKSGTNEFHGSAYEYMFNDMFNANSWEQNALGNKKVHFRQNNFGFTFGGPVIKNRTFFFVDNEYLIRRQAGSVVLKSFPTAAERSGDLTATFWQGYTPKMRDPLGLQAPVLDSSGNPTGVYERLDFLGGNGMIVPQNRIDPVSAAILSRLPAPNRAPRAGTSSQNNYEEGQAATRDTFRFSTRVDHNFTANHQLAARFTTFDSRNETNAVGGEFYTAGLNESKGGKSGNLNYTWVVAPTTLLNLRASVSHTPVFTGAAHAEDLDTSFMPSIYQNLLGLNKLPRIRTSFMQANEYSDAGEASQTASTTYNFNAIATKILSRHTIKVGYEHRRYYDNFTEGGGGNTNQMAFMINPVHQFSGDHGNGAPQGRVDGMGAFLLGINNRNQIAAPATRAMGLSYNALFIQDDWKATSKLTLNLGLRWDREGPTTERNDKLFFWDPDHAPLFTINPGYSWDNALAGVGLTAADVPRPAWLDGGFPNGAILIANSPDFPGRSPQRVDSTQFAPRIGLAYQLNNNTVIRAYGGLMYLPTTGSAGAYSTSSASVPLSDAANAGWHASDDGGRNYISTWQNPFPRESMLTSFSRDIETINLQSSADPGAAPFTRDLHMPREYAWSLSVQEQLPMGFLFEAGYSGNRGLGLLSPNVTSHFPANLLQPQYGDLMTKIIESPNAGQTLENSITGANQQIGLLMYDMPYYGNLNLLGSNIGSSTFHALHLRAEKRLANGFSFLANYTFSRLLDNVGGPEFETTGSVNTRGQGAKRPQTVLPPSSTWGLSAFDQTHRLSFSYIFEVPVGRGRRWASNPDTLGAKVLDAVVGGWGISGFTSYVSGKPISLESSTSNNVNNVIKVNQTYGSYTGSDRDLRNSAFSGDKSQVLISPADGVTASTPRAFDSSKVTNAKFFVLGNLPAVDDNIRHPGFTQTDLSIMKDFLVTESKKLQFRAELQNAFNIRGFGPYTSTIGDPNFGLIQSAGNLPRQIQMSLSFLF